MIGDTLKSVYAQLHERTTSPFLGSLVIFWMLINHRVLLTLFSDLSIYEKFHYIDYHLFPTALNFWVIGLGLPLTLSLLYVFVYPFAAKHIFVFSRTKQVELLNRKKEIDGKILLDENQSREIILSKINMRDELEKRIAEKDIEVRALKDQLEKNDFTEISEGLVTHKNVPKKKETVEGISLSNEELDVLKKIAQEKFSIRQSSLLNKYPESKHIKIKYIVSILRKSDYIASGNNGYVVTPEGLEYIFKNQ